MAKCLDCRHFQGGYCSWHGADVAQDVMQLDSAERDCAGYRDNYE